MTYFYGYFNEKKTYFFISDYYIWVFYGYFHWKSDFNASMGNTKRTECFLCGCFVYINFGRVCYGIDRSGYGNLLVGIRSVYYSHLNTNRRTWRCNNGCLFCCIIGKKDWAYAEKYDGGSHFCASGRRHCTFDRIYFKNHIWY